VTLSIGSGNGCGGQYLFACDLLGSHDGHYPWHSIRHENFFDRFVDVFKTFIDDIKSGSYPAQNHIVQMPDIEYKRFVEWINNNCGKE